MKDNSMFQDIMLDLDVAWKQYGLLGIQVEVVKQKNATRLMLVGSLIGFLLLVLLAISYMIYTDDGINNPWEIVILIINIITINKMYAVVKVINYNHNQVKVINELITLYYMKIQKDDSLREADTFGNLISELKFIHKFEEEE